MVLHYPCTVHAASLTTQLHRRLSNVTWTDFAAWPSLLPTACAADGCARQADLETLNITMVPIYGHSHPSYISPTPTPLPLDPYLHLPLSLYEPLTRWSTPRP